jgi:hypothetical protein
MLLLDIRLAETVYLNVIPQVYYLKLDESDEIYVTLTVAMAKRGFND